MTFNLTPVAKPRMTKRDRWLNPPRPRVAKYLAYKDELCALAKQHKYQPKNVLSLTFYLPMPKSWSQKKKRDMVGTPHLVRPDLSNLVKAFEDSLFIEDSAVWWYRNIQKRWEYEGRIEIYAD